MDVLEISAKTVDEAVQKALAQLGVTREQVRITILSEGKSGGIFGFGAEDARIRVEPVITEAAKPADIINTAKETLETLLKLMEVTGTVSVENYPDESGQQSTAAIAFNIEGDDLGILIGRRGQTIASLQYLLRLMVGHKTNTWLPIVVDAEGYKQRRAEALKTLALRMADHVKTRGAPFMLEPMPAYERRIIHLALADNPAVYTESIGEGESRKVVIRPRRPGDSRPPTPTSRENNAAPRGSSFNLRGNGFNRRQY